MVNIKDATMKDIVEGVAVTAAERGYDKYKDYYENELEVIGLVVKAAVRAQDD